MWNKNATNQDILARLKYAQSSIECGIHSGFPACCIKFYVSEKMWMEDEQERNYLSQIEDQEKKLGYPSWGYIPCPACLGNSNRVDVLPCPGGITCHHEEGKIYEMVRSNAVVLQLLQYISIAKNGFNSIQQMNAPVGGGVARLVASSLSSIDKIVMGEVV